MFAGLRSSFDKLLASVLFRLSIFKTSIQQRVTSSKLTVVDNRTGHRFHVPIDHNTVEAVHFRSAGLKVLDPGFSNTAVVKSQITFIDADRGVIEYRGRPINDLFCQYGWEEVSYLLIWGSLPTKQEKGAFESGLAKAMKPPQLVIDTMKSLPSDSPPAALALTGLAAYAAAKPANMPIVAGNANLYIGQMETVDKAAIETIGSIAAIMALIYCCQHGKDFTQPDPERPFVSNVLLMMGFINKETGVPDRKAVDTLEKLWALYADHEMTNSTSAFLHIASTLADPITCCAGYIASGNGPLHAGAIDLTYQALESLESPDNGPAFIEDVKAKKQRLFGYGHRIYKTVDPRAKFIKTMLKDFHQEIQDDPLLTVAIAIDDLASKDQYFVSRNLKADADLYRCFVYTALGFERDIVAALSMLSRMSGVMAQWHEAMNQPPRLWRPQQVFVGQDESLL